MLFSKFLITAMAVATVFLSASASAQAMSDADKRDLYASCQSGCVSNQKRSPLNAAFLPTPFVLEAVCSCHCSRLSMRMSSGDTKKLALASSSGKPIESIWTSPASVDINQLPV